MKKPWIADHRIWHCELLSIGHMLAMYYLQLLTNVITDLGET
jgi:hypothetical protein